MSNNARQGIVVVSGLVAWIASTQINSPQLAAAILHDFVNIAGLTDIYVVTSVSLLIAWLGYRHRKRRQRQQPA